MRFIPKIRIPKSKIFYGTILLFLAAIIFLSLISMYVGTKAMLVVLAVIVMVCFAALGAHLLGLPLS